MRDLNDKPLFVLVVWERRISPQAGRQVPTWTGPGKPFRVGNADFSVTASVQRRGDP